MTRNPTISEVAKASGVGRATVARTLGGYGYVSEATRKRVLTVADDLGYRPNRLAQSMSTGSTRTIGLVIADVSNPFFGDVVRGASDTAMANGFDTLLVSTYEDVGSEVAAVKLLVDKRVDGIILSTAVRGMDDIGHLQIAEQHSIPIVLLDRSVPRVQFDSVIINNRESVRNSISALISHGHTRIGYAWGPPVAERPRWQSGLSDAARNDLWTDGERMMGYLDALAGEGIELDIDLVMLGEKNEEHAAAEVSRMLGLADPPTAFFCTETEALTGTLSAIREASLSIPKDVSIMGFDDSSWAAVFEPPISMIKQPTRELGVRASNLLLERINGIAEDPRIEELETEVIWRSSIGRPLHVEK
ncbi:LacI family DNA-binding transcriptional regulator [Brevibacterium sp. K11IcPPYGO002]|uniref:LacI family DNA-binding transcriptional regulator n=1 Tax=Brevibacterium sp. K11IcPPYGO002 TaxID=3058837 RepID=UPI003D819BBF